MRFRKPARRLAVLLAAAIGATIGVAVIAAPAQAALPTGHAAIGLGRDTDLRVLSSGTSTATAVVAAPYSVGVSGQTVLSQRWTLDMTIYVEEEISAGYKIKNAQTGQCLGRSSVANNSPVIAKACSSEVAQLWTVPMAAPNGGVQLQNMADYRCLDLAGGSTAANAPLRVSTCNSAATAWWQRFKLRYGSFTCDRRSNQRILTGLCVNTGSAPMYGAFGTWRNLPITYTAAARNQANTVDNFIELRSRTAQNEDLQADGIELGYHQALANNVPQVYPYWTEWGPSGQEYHSVLNTEGGSIADGRNHSYLILPSETTSGEWDVLYDYNTVGTTHLQEGAQFLEAYANLAVANPSSGSTTEQFQNRLQLFDANGVFRRPYLGETSRTEPKTCSALPTDVDPLWDEFNAPPWCMTTGFGTRATTPVTVDYMAVGVPRTGSGFATAKPAPAAPAATGVIGGVDQRDLRACLESTPDACLDKVAGLRDCVAARATCSSVKKAGKSSDVYVETGAGEVRGLGNNGDATYQGYRRVYTADRSTLLYACLGTACPRTAS